jgi:hypothetical protein
MLRFMQRVLLPFLLLLCFNEVGYSQAVTTYAHRVEGKNYKFDLTPELLDASPSWDDRQDNPPLSARRAIAAAKTYLNELFPDNNKWGMEELELQRIHGDKWIYVARFLEPASLADADKPVDFAGPVGRFEIIVLMNGNVLRAKIEPSKPRAPHNR